jgi:hypothetical protein
MTSDRPRLIDTQVHLGCHMCIERFDSLADLRDHWQRDHNYNVTFRAVTPDV